jgi:hypothetical protein
MISNQTAVLGEAHQAHIVVDIAVVKLGVVLLLLLAIRYSYLNANYLYLVIVRRTSSKEDFLLVSLLAVGELIVGMSLLFVDSIFLNCSFWLSE